MNYLGFTVPNRFVVGYGTDLYETDRNLSDIYSLDENAAKNDKQDV
jgi:hypoxanthine-guanine phosphoribosyltransferase